MTPRPQNEFNCIILQTIVDDRVEVKNKTCISRHARFAVGVIRILIEAVSNADQEKCNKLWLSCDCHQAHSEKNAKHVPVWL